MELASSCWSKLLSAFVLMTPVSRHGFDCVILVIVIILSGIHATSDRSITHHTYPHNSLLHSPQHHILPNSSTIPGWSEEIRIYGMPCNRPQRDTLSPSLLCPYQKEQACEEVKGVFEEVGLSGLTAGAKKWCLSLSLWLVIRCLV